ncbi:MAG: hypothetical protein ACPHXR_02840 [Flavicella sp.]
MKAIKIITALSITLLFSCKETNKASKETLTDTIEIKSVGFAGSPENSWLLGNQESLDIWIQWCDLHVKKDIEGILNLASDSIRIKAPNDQTINGKEEFKAFITQWLSNNDISIKQEWGIPINFVDKDGKKDEGDWIINGHKLNTRNGENMTQEDNHANVYIKNGKVRFFKIYNHQTTTSKMVSATFSVDLSNYKEKFETVCLNGTFNNWCGSCNTMTDDDKDGVYEITLDVPAGEIEYKFTLDSWKTQETFEAGTVCTKTVAEFTNRVASITDKVTLPTVCFNACNSCE